jgi:hypothetical protein
MLKKMECSICLEKINTKDEYKLTCNHSFHKKCYRACVFSNNLNIFIDCPLCRGFNYNNDKLSCNSLENLRFFCYSGRCCHETKEGNRCKNKSIILNYGYCYSHNKEILPKDKYELMVDFIYWMLEGNNKCETKLTMIDITKKLLIQNPNMMKLNEILTYFYRFYHYYKHEGNLQGQDNSPLIRRQEMYRYYDLELVEDGWHNRCLDKKIIF